MASLRNIKRRITSVTSTQKITRAMKMVAAAKLRRAQEAILHARPYAFRMRDLVNSLALRAEQDAHPLFRRGTGQGRVELIVVTSDRGLCGAFNSNVVNHTMATIKESFADRDVEITVIGRKGAELLKRRPCTIRAAYTDVAGSAALDTASTIIEDVSAGFARGDIDEVHCIYNEFRSAISQNITCEQLLPFEAAPAEGDRLLIDYLYEPDATQVFEVLLGRHIRIQLHRIVQESAASEHGARMTAMDSATTNAGEMIDKLTLLYNRLRQDVITKELIEVISGAEAI